MLQSLEHKKVDFKNKIFLEFGILLCFSGIYYNFDMPVGLYKPIREHFRDQPMIYNNFEIYYNFLYGAMAWINIFFPILLGILSDLLGNRYLLGLISACNFLGASFLYIGVKIKDFQLMIFGRFVVGVAIGSIFPISSKIVIPYFRSKNLAFVQNFNLGIACFFDAFCAIMSPVFASKFDLNITVFFGVVAGVFCIIGCIIVVYLDIQAEKQIVVKSLVMDFPPESRQLRSEEHAKELESDINQEQNNDLATVVKKFPFEFWLIAFYMGLNFASYIGSEANLVPIQEDVILSKQAKEIIDENDDIYIHNAIIGCFMAPVFVLPISGYIVDVTGWNCGIALFAALLQAFIQFTCYYIDGIVYATLLGVCFSLFISSLWSTIPSLIDKDILGAGYGFLMSTKFLGVTIATILIGYMSHGQEPKQKYVGALYTMGSFNLLAAFIILILRSRFVTLGLLGYAEKEENKKQEYQSASQELQQM